MKFKKVNPERLLNTTIRELLYGGATDPGWVELETVAALYVLMKHLQLTVKGEEDVLRQLQGENVHERDFLKIHVK
jgi:hypothetical protein